MRYIYIDTSVFGGKFDSEFQYWTERFFSKVLQSDIKMFLSDVAEDELLNAPPKVLDFLNKIPQESLIKINLTEDAILLANKYINQKVVGQSSRADCYHIAMATLFKADLLVSWNFKHIVNIDRIRGYNAVNLMNGYHILEIRNPREAFNYENY